METKKIVIAIVLIALIGVGAWVVISSQEGAPFKGVWMPTLDYALLYDNFYYGGLTVNMWPVFSDLDKAEECGINTLAFAATHRANENGEVSLLPGAKEALISFIENVKERGFKIWLSLEILYPENGNHPGRIPDEVIENTDLLANFDSAVVEWATIAQDYNIEIFCPLNEAEAKFGVEKSIEWLVEIKPKIDAVYSGKIMVKRWPRPELSSYSCFGPGINLDVLKNEEEKNNLINQIEEARKQNVELMMGEIWEGGFWQGTDEEAKIGLAMALEAGKGRVSGFFVLDALILRSDGQITHSLCEDFESTLMELYSGL